jgi:hypothetical protein
MNDFLNSPTYNWVVVGMTLASAYAFYYFIFEAI